MRGWMFSWPGVAMKSATSPDFDVFDDPLAHAVPGQVEVLADVGEPAVRRPRRRCTPRPGCRGRAPSPSGALNARRSVSAIAMPAALAEIAELNAFTISDTAAVCEPDPLVPAAEQRARVRRAVLRRHEERVRRHVVDEHEPPVRMRLDERLGGQRLLDAPERRTRQDGRRHGRRRRDQARTLEEAPAIEDELLTLLGVVAAARRPSRGLRDPRCPPFDGTARP